MTPQELYAATLKACPIKPGDEVRVLRKWEYGEMGCALYLGDACSNGQVGKTYRVDLKTANGYELSNDFSYPWFVLELVKAVVPPVTIRLNSCYDAKVSTYRVEVGCQTFTHETIDMLYAASRKARGLTES